MSYYRFTGKAMNGKSVQTEFEAPNLKEARLRADNLVKQKALQLESLDEKKVWLYKARKNGTGWVEGEQEAYSQNDLKIALQKLGYSDLTIKKKVEFWKAGVPNEEVVTFIRLSADLLRQKLPYDEILTLLYEDTVNTRMKEVIKQIQKDLRDGKEGREVYARHDKIFGKFAAYMLGIATTSGNVAEVFDSTAKFMERDANFKKNIRRTLFMPMVTVLAVVGVVLFYVGYIFPKTAEMFLKFDIELPPMTEATLNLSYWITDYWILITVLFLGPLIAFIFYIRTPKGKLNFDKYIIKVPVIGDLLHKTSIEIFARVFYTLYSGSGQNIEVIKIASEACRNSYMEKQIKEKAIRSMLRDGTGLVESMQLAGVFTNTAISRFKLGVESGSIRENSRQLAEYYETQTGYKMESVINTINLFVNMFIMVALVGITIVSSEAAIIKPKSQF